VYGIYQAGITYNVRRQDEKRKKATISGSNQRILPTPYFHIQYYISVVFHLPVPLQPGIDGDISQVVRKRNGGDAYPNDDKSAGWNLHRYPIDFDHPVVILHHVHRRGIGRRRRPQRSQCHPDRHGCQYRDIRHQYHGFPHSDQPEDRISKSGFHGLRA